MPTIRQATSDDIDTLVDLRLQFLDEIGHAGPDVPDAVRRYMIQAVPAGNHVAWLAEQASQPIATGGFVLTQKVPHARNLSGREAFVLGVNSAQPFPFLPLRAFSCFLWPFLQPYFSDRLPRKTQKATKT